MRRQRLRKYVIGAGGSLVLVIGLALAGGSARATVSGSTFHGSVTEAHTFCGDQEVPNLPGTIGGLWNFNVSARGHAELSIVVTNDTLNAPAVPLALPADFRWVAASDDAPPTFYHYTSSVGSSTFDLRFTPATGEFSLLRVVHSDGGCVVHGNADRILLVGVADRG